MSCGRTMGSGVSSRRRGSVRSASSPKAVFPRALLQCPLCLKETTDSKILPCHHYFCSSCYDKISNSSEATCKLCNQKWQLLSGLTKAKTNKVINDLVACQQLLLSDCEGCQSPNPEFICTDCKKAMCALCRDRHLRDDVISSHSVAPREVFRREYVIPKDHIICPWHGEKFDLFCAKCNVIICRKCADGLVHYHGHKTKPLSLENGRKRMEKDLGMKTKQIATFIASIKDVMNEAEKLGNDNSMQIAKDNILRLAEEDAGKGFERDSNFVVKYSALLDELEKMGEDQTRRLSVLESQCKTTQKTTTLLFSASKQFFTLDNDILFLYLVKQLLGRITSLIRSSDSFAAPFLVEYVESDRAGEMGYLRKSCNPRSIVRPKFSLQDTYTTGHPLSLSDERLAPHGLTIQNDTVVVAERAEHRLRLLDRKDGCLYPSNLADDWNDTNKFDPVDVATINEKEVAVTDFENKCFHIFDIVERKYRGSFGHGELCGPQGIAKTKDGFLAITDCNCQTFDRDCTVKIMTVDGAVVRELSREKYSFHIPWGVTVNSENDLIIANQRSHSVKVICEDGDTKCDFGMYGYDTGCFRGPIALAVDKFDNIIVGSDNAVQIFSPAGRFLCRVNRDDRIDGGVCGLAFRLHEKDYQIIVSDTENNQIKIYKLETGSVCSKK